MMNTSIQNLLVAKALPFINRNLSVSLNINYTIWYAGVLFIILFYIQSIGSGVAIYSGLFNFSESLYFNIDLQLYGLYVLTNLNRDSDSSTKANLNYLEEKRSSSLLPCISKASSKLRKVNPFKLDRGSFLLGTHNFHTFSILGSNINNSSRSSSSTITTTQDTIPAPYSNLTSEAQEQLTQRRNALTSQTEQVQGQNSNMNIQEQPELEGLNGLNLPSSFAEGIVWQSLRLPHYSELSISSSNPLRDSVRFVSSYLQHAENIDPNLIRRGILTEILAPIIANPNITPTEIANHIERVVRDDPSFFFRLSRVTSAILNRSRLANPSASSSSINPSASSSSINPDPSASSSSINPNSSSSSINSSVSDVLEPRPFGEYGQMTINQLATRIQNYQLEGIIGDLRVNPFPLVAYGVSAGFIIRTYMQQVHNRPYLPNMTPQAIRSEQLARNRHLAIFMLGGVPLILGATKWIGLGLKDVFSFNILIPVPANTEGSGSNVGKHLVLFFSSLNKFGLKLPNLFNFRNKLPKWLIIIIILIILSFILSLNLWGNSFILLITSSKFWMYYFYVVFTMGILDQIILLVLMHLFIRRKIRLKKLQFLPNFLISFLKGIQAISNSQKEARKQFQKRIVLHLIFFLACFILVFLIF